MKNLVKQLSFGIFLILIGVLALGILIYYNRHLGYRLLVIIPVALVFIVWNIHQRNESEMDKIMSKKSSISEKEISEISEKFDIDLNDLINTVRKNIKRNRFISFQ